jgi:hypothetical protein
MEIETVNVPKDLVAITHVALEFFADNFMSVAQREKITVCVEFQYEKNPDIIAYCDFPPPDKGLPVDFDLMYSNKVRDIPIRDYITSIFHEMTHVLQYATGVLSERGALTVWKGKKYSDASDTEYWLQPWEIEAYGMETCAYQYFVAKHPEIALKKYKHTSRGRRRSDWRKIAETLDKSVA